MSIKAILFDLDGTLLPMDHDKFSKLYFGLISQKLAPCGYDPTELINAIMVGIAEMVKNNGDKTNETVCWEAIACRLGESVFGNKALFEEFYRKEFDDVRNACGFDPQAAETVSTLKSMGYRIILATNPLFPSVATEKRIAWAGLNADDFELFTTYENSRFSKPNIRYYEEILAKTGLRPEECLMVGNDVDEDMIAEKLGMKVYLVKDCLVNKRGADITSYPQGDFQELLRFIERGGVK